MLSNLKLSSWKQWPGNASELTHGRADNQLRLDGGQWQESSSASNVAADANPIEIKAQRRIYSVAFLANGMQVVSGGREKKIRRWRVEDGKEVGKPMDAGSVVYNLAVSQDGQWIVHGTPTGQVSVWDAKTHEKVIHFKAHSDWVRALDISCSVNSIKEASRDDCGCVLFRGVPGRLDSTKPSLH